jgi:signal transduction histidine kinase
MGVKTGFWWVLAIWAVIAVAAGMAFLYSQTVFTADTSRSERLDHLATEGTRLVQLTYEVLLYGEARAVQQWQRQFDNAGAAIAEVDVGSDPALRTAVDALTRRFADLRPLEQRLVELRAAEPQSPLVSILASQLFQTSAALQTSLREIKAHADAGLRAAYAQSKQRQIAILGLSAALMAVLGMTALALFRTIIVKPLDALGRTIAALRDGPGARVDVRADDEIGVVCRTFNELLDEQEDARRRLERQAAMLQRTNADLESYTWIASHDMREPLRQVSNYVGLIERRLGAGADEDMRGYMRTVINGVKRMDALIRDVQEYAGIGYGGERFDAVRLGTVLAQSLATLKDAVDASGATVVIPAALPVVKGAAEDFVRLFANLIENAIKFRHPERAPEIVVTAGAAGPDWWRIAIADNGIGIDSEYHDRIFGIFQRLQSGWERPGTGIGLSLCKKIVERYGGTISVASVPGEGSVFSFTLPAAVSDKGTQDECPAGMPVST